MTCLAEVASCPNEFSLRRRSLLFHWVTCAMSRLLNCAPAFFSGKLLGHLFTIVDIAVNEKDQQLISLSTARVSHCVILRSFSCIVKWLTCWKKGKFERQQCAISIAHRNWHEAVNKRVKAQGLQLVPSFGECQTSEQHRDMVKPHTNTIASNLRLRRALILKLDAHARDWGYTRRQGSAEL